MLGAAVRLYGRTEQNARLTDLIRGVESERGEALVLLGEPGVGKSALLERLVADAPEVTVLRASGIESESELAFAGLHQLLGPVLSDLEELAGIHRRALLNALGLDEVGPHDRFAVSLALLELCSELANERGLLCVIDDAHWLDRPSLDAIAFVARRIEAEPIAIVLAARPGHEFDVRGLPLLTLRGLQAEPANELLREHAGPELAPEVGQRIIAVAEGNPLALIELTSSLSSAQLSGHEILVGPFPVGQRTRRAFLGRARSLNADARALLLLAAADTSTDLATLQAAAEYLGIDLEVLDDIEDAGFVEVTGGVVRFRHSLARLAVYHAASSKERRHAHAALARALSYPPQTDRRAWHLAAASLGSDESIAEQLERSAITAQHRGGHSAAAALLQRAAELSVVPASRGRRLVAAAEATWNAGVGQPVDALLRKAQPLIDDAHTAAIAATVEGAYVLSRGAPDAAFRTFVAGARYAISEHPALALDLLCHAAEVSWWSGRGDWAAEVALHGAQIATDSPDAAFRISLLVAGDHALNGRPGLAGQAVREVLALAQEFDDPRHLMLAGEAAGLLGEDLIAHSFHSRAVAALRASGTLSELPFALWLLASYEVWQGKLDAATVNAHEGLRLAEEIGEARSGTFQLAILGHIEALHGRSEECRAYAAAALESVAGREHASPPATMRWALGRLELGLGRPVEALEHLVTISDAGSGVAHPIVALYAAPDLVEAAVRVGHRSLAEEALQQVEQWAAAGSSWAISVVPRLRAIMAEGETATEYFEAALVAHAALPRPFERARTQLLFGEHLRRMRRRIDAREQLRSALATFEGMNVEPWTERARAELRASGETARRREPSTIDDLTPQELQVARLVSAGASNREVAAKLFLSSRTVEYHLRKIYLKLGISSRAHLSKALEPLP